jgi:hypothetical protein
MTTPTLAERLHLTSGPTRKLAKIILVVVDFGVAVGAPVWNYYFGRSDTALQAGAGLIAVTTFISVWFIQRSRRYNLPTTDSMRDGVCCMDR